MSKNMCGDCLKFDACSSESITGAYSPACDEFKDNGWRYNVIEVDNKSLRFNKGKTRLDLIPVEPLCLLGHVCEMGIDKYGEHNWLRGSKWSNMVASAMRHIDAFRGGEDYDPESGAPHLVHAAWNMLALTEYMLRGIGEDDRVFKLSSEYRKIAPRPVEPAEAHDKWTPLINKLQEIAGPIGKNLRENEHDSKTLIHQWVMEDDISLPINFTKIYDDKLDVQQILLHLQAELPDGLPLSWLAQSLYNAVHGVK